jgi:hypothetical protein
LRVSSVWGSIRRRSLSLAGVAMINPTATIVMLPMSSASSIVPRLLS